MLPRACVKKKTKLVLWWRGEEERRTRVSADSGFCLRASFSFSTALMNQWSTASTEVDFSLEGTGIVGQASSREGKRPLRSEVFLLPLLLKGKGP